jgi:hypothetical protein
VLPAHVVALLEHAVVRTPGTRCRRMQGGVGSRLTACSPRRAPLLLRRCLRALQMFEKVVIVDGRGHLLGRLASVVAKELLGG